MSLILGGCRDVTLLTGVSDPDSVDPAVTCTTADCGVWRSAPTASMVSLVSRSSEVAAGLKNQALAVRIEGHLARMRTALGSGDAVGAGLSLLGALAAIDSGLANPAIRADWADLSAIRLNLEPVLIHLGLR